MKISENGLPLFPLQTVLFPQAHLPLHIFEPRYREMIDRCVREDLAFGVMLIKEGVEVGGPATPHTIGTIARIVDVARLSDGRMNIATTGVIRFRLLEQFNTRAYFTGRIALLSDEHVEPEKIESDVREVKRLFTEYVRAVRQASQPDESEQELGLPTDPIMLSYIVASALPISALDRQSLLEAETTKQRLNRELVFLRREAVLLRMLTTQNPRVRDQGAFSLN